MKNLRSCIKNYLNESVWDINESVWDIEDNIESDNKEFVIDDVKNFIDDNYEHGLSQDCEFVFDEKLGKYIVNCKKTAWFASGEEYLTNGMFKWGVVKGHFYCRELKNLKSLDMSSPIFIYNLLL